jgi:putative FmdB family regulatory protein
MPTYEYTCKNCGDTIEVFQKFTDKPLKVHDVCGGELKKVIHARGVVFKGEGFYATDSRRTSSASKSDSNGADKPKTESKPKSEKKAKTETTVNAD